MKLYIIRERTLKKWEFYCGINESKIINYNNETSWMCGINSEVRIFDVNNNRA